MEKRVSADVMKTTRIWIVRVDPRYHPKCPHERETGESRRSQRRRQVTGGGEGGRWPETKEHQGTLATRATGKRAARLTPASRTRAPQN